MAIWASRRPQELKIVAKKKTKKVELNTKTRRKTASGKSKSTSKKTTKKPTAKKPAVKKAAPKKTAAKKTTAKKKTTGLTPKITRPRTSAKASSAKSNQHRSGTLRISQYAPAKPASNKTPAPLNPVNLMIDPQDIVTPMTPKELEFFRELLLEKRAEIAGDVSTLRSQALSGNRQESSGDLSNMPIHMADLGTDNYEKEFTLGLLESERNLLWEIDEALKRIEQGTYGVCLATGRPIGKNRLKAQPWVKYCYEYVLAQERGQAQNRW